VKELIAPSKATTNIFVITPQFLLRVAGLPINAVVQLRFEQTLMWQQELFRLEGLLQQQKEAVVEHIYRAVRLHEDERGPRQKLINLKRDIYNLRLPADAQAARSIGTLLPQDGQLALFAWLDLWDRYQQHLLVGAPIFEQEIQQRRALLKKVLGSVHFRKGILLASPLLDQATDAYLAADNLRLNREARTVEHSLLEYFFRTACKASPFSTFTSVCLGSVEGGSTAERQEAIDVQLSSMVPRSFTRLNMIVLARLSALILNCPAVRNALHVRLTNGWQIQGNSVLYVRRKSADDAEHNMMPVDSIQEQVIRLPLSALLQDLIALLSTNTQQLGAVIQQLCAQGPYRHAEAKIEAYLHHLLRLGFLIVPALQINIHHDHPLRAFCHSLSLIAYPLTDALAEELIQVDALVGAYASAAIDRRRELLRIIEQRLQYCGRLLSPEQESILLPKALLYEDTTLTPQRLQLHEQQFHTLFAQLKEIQQILPIFDMRIAEKLTARGYFQARYGVGRQCDDFLSFANMFAQEFKLLQWRDIRQKRGGATQGTFQPYKNYFALPEIERLNTASQLAIDCMEKAYAAYLAHDDQYEVLLADDLFHKVVAQLADMPGELQSHSFFAQMAHVHKEEPLLVLNQVYTGLTLMFSRFAHSFPEEQTDALVAMLRRTLAQIQPPGAIFAELKGGYDATNLNLHPGVTPYELVCPGELSMRPAEEQILLGTLSIQDDVEAGCLRLYSKQLGKEIIPLYLGFLTPAALPLIQQILLNFSYLSIGNLNMWRGIKLADTNTSPTFYPRVRYKNVVIQRATWKIDAFPKRARGESDSSFYLNVARWRKEIGLPAQVFVSPSASSKTTAYKPFYVDFENYFSLIPLEAAMRQTDAPLLMTEMLPAAEDAWFEHERSAHVSEFVFEISNRREESNG